MEILKKLQAKQEDLCGAPAVTIAFLGDSVTQGCFEVYKTGPESIETVFEAGNSYAAHLRRMLAVLYPNVPVHIINSGISGDNAPGGAARLERDVLRFHPDLVVVSFGLNDSVSGLDGLPRYTEALSDIFSRTLESGSECIFLTENMMNTRQSCHIQDDFLKTLSAQFADIENSGVLAAYFDAAKKTAQRCGVRVCDCYAKWRTMARAGVDTTALLANDLNHPSREMVQLFAYSLLETMFSA